MAMGTTKRRPDRTPQRLKPKHWIQALLEIDSDSEGEQDSKRDELDDSDASWNSYFSIASDLSALMIGMSEDKEGEDWEVVSQVSSVQSMNTAGCEQDRERRSDAKQRPAVAVEKTPTQPSGRTAANARDGKRSRKRKKKKR